MWRFSGVNLGGKSFLSCLLLGTFPLSVVFLRVPDFLPNSSTKLDITGTFGTEGCEGCFSASSSKLCSFGVGLAGGSGGGPDELSELASFFKVEVLDFVLLESSVFFFPSTDKESLLSPFFLLFFPLSFFVFCFSRAFSTSEK